MKKRKGAIMQKLHTPIQTARDFVANYLKLDINIMSYNKKDGTLSINANDAKDNTYNIIFDNFDVTCTQIGNVKNKWLHYVFYNDQKYFYEYCDAMLQESKETVEDDRQHIDSLIEQGIYNPD